MIATLPMYKRPELVEAHNRYWALIRAALIERDIDSPKTLSQEYEDEFAWANPKLVLSQTCGMPYRLWLHDKVTLIGTPDFGVEGCPPGYYRSVIVIRRTDPRQSIDEFKEVTFAYNQPYSQSGYAAPYWHCRQYGFWFEKRLHKIHHLHSAQAIVSGEADIAALDAVTWRLMVRYESFTQDLRVFGWTKPTPGLPYIAAATANQALTFTAVEQAIALLSPDDRALLGIRGLVAIPKELYLALPKPDDIN